MPPTEVLGFSLFMLCHDFGRRGRAMVRSLARQVGVEVPLRLTVFHCDPEDARLIEEGASDGAFSLSFVPVDQNRVLRRALLFSEAKPDPTSSHMVFLDADLWFPQAFWAEYTRALRGETSGYWSCRVMNVPYPESERFVAGWREIDPQELEAVQTGRRLDAYGGRVGHFQCVPVELARYPADPLPAVHTLDLAFAKEAVARSVDQRFERRICAIGVYHLDHPASWEGTKGRKL